MRYIIMCLVMFCLNPLSFAAMPQKIGFVTTQDYLKASDATSKIAINNNSGGSITLTGLFIQRAFEISSGDCNSPGTINYTATYDGIGYGIIWVPVTFSNGQSSTIGANFLYNMLNQFLGQNFGATNGGAASKTPGFGNGVSGAIWCIKLGATNTANAVTIPPGAPPISGNQITAGNTSNILINCYDPTTNGLTSGQCIATTNTTVNFPV